MAWSAARPSWLLPPVVLDHFLNDEIQELLGEFRVQISPGCQILEPRDLSLLARGVGWREVVMRFQRTHGLRVLEPFGQREDKDRIQPVDAVAMLFQKRGGARDGILWFSQWPSLSV